MQRCSLARMHTPRSPDGTRRADLLFAGEIRFGPAFFRLSIGGRAVPHRIFGAPLCWSADARLLAAQEWLTTDYGTGPVTCAVLIDVAAWTIARQEVVVKGFAEDFRFGEDGVLHYAKVFPARGERVQARAAPDALQRWVGIDAAPIATAEF